MRCRLVHLAPVALLVMAPVMAPSPAAATEVTASFRFPLSSFSGPVPSQWAQLAVDRDRGEVYALNHREKDIRIFDEHGMQVFVFGDGFAAATDLAIGDGGDIFLLSTTGRRESRVDLLNYRGEHVSEVALRNVPEAYADFFADRIVYKQGSLYLVSSIDLRVLVVDAQGEFEEAYDLSALLMPFVTRDERLAWALQDVDWKRRKLRFIDLGGFTVDDRGRLLFTVPVMFCAFRVSHDGRLEQFGASGSSPGRFGVAAGIAADADGYVYVADRLRSVVLVFDPGLHFQAEFGYRGLGPSNLISPGEVAVDGGGNVYVAQAANRGVSVFRVVHDGSGAWQDAGDTRVGRKVKASSWRSGRKARGKRSVPAAGSSGAHGQAVSPSAVRAAVAALPELPPRPAPVVEEALAAPAEFIPDPGVDPTPAVSAASDWTIEERESDQLEVNGDGVQ
jgi:DNA-binding beta-propeller fold protein YncE